MCFQDSWCGGNSKKKQGSLLDQGPRKKDGKRGQYSAESSRRRGPASQHFDCQRLEDPTDRLLLQGTAAQKIKRSQVVTLRANFPAPFSLFTACL